MGEVVGIGRDDEGGEAPGRGWGERRAVAAFEVAGEEQVVGLGEGGGFAGDPECFPEQGMEGWAVEREPQPEAEAEVLGVGHGARLAPGA